MANGNGRKVSVWAEIIAVIVILITSLVAIGKGWGDIGSNTKDISSLDHTVNTELRPMVIENSRSCDKSEVHYQTLTKQMDRVETKLDKLIDDR